MIVRLTAILLCSSLVAAPVEAQQAVEAELTAEIAEARRALAAREREIADASSQLNARIRRAQQAVIELRRDAAELQRASDDQTLGLEVLEARLQQWQEQEAYQQNLLLGFARRISELPPSQQNFAGAIASLQSSVAQFERRLTPTFTDHTAVEASGQAVSGEALRLGPVTWFLHEAGGGVLTPGDEGATDRLEWSFETAALNDLMALASTGNAAVTFDPTLGRYLELRASQQSMFDHVRAGGFWAIPILGFALVSLIIALIKVLQFTKLPKLDARSVIPLLQRVRADGPDTGTAPEPLGALLKLLAAPATEQQREDQLFDFLLAQRSRLQHLIGAVAITATVSPLLGLLGTVSGMIKTFQSMTVFGSGDPSVVSGGISEALVTTELGLVVAVPSLIIHALLKRKADTYADQLESTAVALANRAGTV
ncbi:MAG: MotA/TolQ/ExbB proton channel family protein [Pseudomonadota bacterium]